MPCCPLSVHGGLKRSRSVVKDKCCLNSVIRNGMLLKIQDVVAIRDQHGSVQSRIHHGHSVLPTLRHDPSLPGRRLCRPISSRKASAVRSLQFTNQSESFSKSATPHASRARARHVGRHRAAPVSAVVNGVYPILKMNTKIDENRCGTGNCVKGLYSFSHLRLFLIWSTFPLAFSTAFFFFFLHNIDYLK